MKKLPALLSTPARIVIAVGLIVLGSEVLIMVLIEIIHATLLKDDYLASVAWKFIDPIVLTAMVSPALYFLIFRPLNQQAKLERQLDELRRFQNVTVGRELRMKELMEENTALRHPLSAEPAGAIPVTSGSLQAPRDVPEQYVATHATEENQRRALLLMLEDLEAARKKIEEAHQEWMAALDVVNDPIFLHDKQFRILRCNRAYRQCAGLPFKQIIGRPYYEIFPKTGAPLAGCLRVMEKAGAAADVKEMVIGDTIYRSRTYSVYGEQGAYLHSVHILEDITERKRAESVLRQTQERLRNIIDGLGPSMFVGLLTTEGVVLEANQQALAAAGLKPEDVLGKPVEETYWFSYSEECKRQMREGVARAARGEALRYDVQIRAAENQYIPLDFSLQPFRDATGRVVLLVPSAIVITERKKAEEALKSSEEKLQKIIDGSSAVIFVKDTEGKYLLINSLYAKLFHVSKSEVIGKTDYDIFPKETADALREVDLKVLKTNNLIEADEVVPQDDGVHYYISLKFPLYDKNNRPYAVCGIATDITARKQAEAALRESEERFASAFHTSPAAITITRVADGKFLDANQAFLDMFEFNRDEVIGHTSTELNILSVADRSQLIRKQLETGGLRDAELLAHSKSGRPVHLLFSSKPIELAGETHHVTTLIDITERKQAEVALNHANRALATLSAVNRNLVHASDENELLQAICDAIVEQKGYRMAWVGYVQHDESKSIRIMARAGYDAGYLDALQVSWAENERGIGPSGRAVRSGATQLCQDIANDPHYSLWREAALKRGYAASIGLPLLGADGTVFGILNVYAAEANAFTPNEVDLLEEMASDLAFGVRGLHTRRERDLALEQSRLHLEKLRNSLEDTVRAIATIVEMRDPYTAGHQVRVANLAAAIAKQMALPEEQIHAIHLAGVVHDLGKIKVPAEILSKPGRINDLEFGLIKVHPQAGYDILKSIDFPWPIAQMVWQHHERLDGSGYPQGLKGEAILLEARILAVADVVEAMSAHRPYRPGLGIEVALAEITKQRGIHYDPRVVDACLALFREQGYSFK